VAGHGMGPAMLMSEARAYLRMLARRLNQTGDILTSANEVLGEDLSFERYITVILLSLEAEARRLTFSNAGHPPGIILDASGAIKALLKRQGVPLGIQPNCLYPSSETVTLNQGDLVFLYTDGFDEAMSEDGNFFGMESMAEVIHEHRHLPATQILECLRESVVQFTGNQPQADDLTGILIKVL